MNKSPNIVFITHPFYSINHKDNDYKMYFGKDINGKKIIVDCKNKETYRERLQQYVSGFYGYSRNEKKANTSLFDYFRGSEKEISIMEKNKMKREKMAVGKNGNYVTDEDVKIMKKTWVRNIENSNLHICVISFDNEYIDSNINIEELQKKFATDVMPKFLKKLGYSNPKQNLDWIVSLHCDTDNYHFHFAFLENKPSFLTKNNELKYKNKLLIDELEQNFLKKEVALTIEREKHYRNILIKFNNDLEEYKKYFNPKSQNFKLKNIESLEIEEKILRLGHLLKKVRTTDRKYIKYNSLPKNEIGKEIRYLTKDIKDSLVNSKDLTNKFDEINKSINDINNFFIKINEENHIKEILNNNDNTLIKDKMNRLDNYILNAIVNHSLYKFDYYNKKLNMDELKIEDLIIEFSKLKYKKENNYNDKKNLKKKLLNNYFKNKGYKKKNISSIERAFFNFSKEQEKAVKQFYEMFENDYYKE